MLETSNCSTALVSVIEVLDLRFVSDFGFEISDFRH